MSANPLRLLPAVALATGLLTVPVPNAPRPVTALGIGATPAHAQWQATACRIVWVAGRAVWHCARGVARFVYHGWRYPRATPPALIGLGPAGLIAGRPRPVHAPGLYRAPAPVPHFGPRVSQWKLDQMRYYAQQRQQLGGRYGAVQMPRTTPGMYARPVHHPRNTAVIRDRAW